MQRLITYIVLILSLSAQYTLGQNYKLASEQYPEHRYYPLKGEIFYKDYRQVMGTAYLTEDWSIGTIYLSNGEVLLNVKYKFDAYIHKLLVYNDYMKRIVNVEREDIDYFTLEEAERTRLFKNVNSEKSFRLGNKGYIMEVLAEGNVGLYKLYFQDIIPLRVPVMPYIDEFVKGTNYFLFLDGNFELARLKKSYLLHKFPQYKAEIKQFIRKNKIKLRNEDQYAQAIGYINQLQVATAGTN